MEGRTFKHLTLEQVDCFMKHGYLRVPGCFTREAAEEWTKDVWVRLGFDPNNPDTWTTERTNMPGHGEVKVKDFAPKAYNAICELIGGEERITEDSKSWRDSFIVNLGTKEHEGKEAHPKELTGWHVDGDFFVHFLDSPEQGLLVIPLFTDVLPNGGGTWICSEGVRKIGKWLYDHPQGVLPRMSPVGGTENFESGLEFYHTVVQGCDDASFHEMTGSVGDVILLHPLMLHSASKNGRRLPRIITNPPVSLVKPFNFDREDESQYSLVELKTIKELGGQDMLRGWKIQGKREGVVPERVRRQARMLEEEKKRLKERELQSQAPRPVAVA
ncbi:uncharacterized protein Z519_08862 [Cladophialophora bantiana CBS 173.52]|uniref:Phytanoyl-CoA dioxygenase n=1 Tax=Cladophialophora bantiana (strain ATCC 10958 / CBS 173.52 / CDC B-1940 / NIH 8579) TaxID=1442370 RepID=A0A0D2HAC6_CLAB1|nr:uncharacterized protein Z519_08862 [Cladophialophora bantiana CBS 173.52]KIW90218.1 hypothetical protein Z519_08862 [Cladophialophora bantiana CBS 173.52]